MSRTKIPAKSGFTLVELMMVVLLLAILGAIAIPNLIDFKRDAKNGATYAALGVLRTSITVAIANIESMKDANSLEAKYPTLVEIQENAFSDIHSKLKGTWIVDPKQGIPRNPWTLGTLSQEEQKKIVDCGPIKNTISKTQNEELRGWCYSETTGEIWANTDLNHAEQGQTENFF